MIRLLEAFERWRRERRLRLCPAQRNWHDHSDPRHGVCMRRLKPSGDYEYRQMTEAEAHEHAEKTVW